MTKPVLAVTVLLATVACQACASSSRGREPAPDTAIDAEARRLMASEKVQGLALALINLNQLSPAMRIPMFFPYLAVPVGAALMIIELAAGVLQDIYPAEPGIRRKISAATLDG